VGASTAVRITTSRSLNKGGGLSKGGKRSSMGGNSASTKLCGYQ